MNEQSKPYNNFKEFYPFYLAEHQNLTCRRLHVIGSALVIVVAVTAVATRQCGGLRQPLARL